jgi:hypothetical protein
VAGDDPPAGDNCHLLLLLIYMGCFILCAAYETSGMIRVLGFTRWFEWRFELPGRLRATRTASSEFLKI